MATPIMRRQGSVGVVGWYALAVLLTAGAVDLAPLLNNPKIGSILEAGQPSVTVLGVGDIAFGKRSPAGRMVQMVYPASFVDEVSMFDFNMRPGPR